MKRVVVDHFGGPEVLRVVEEEDPRPGPGEVRVKVLAAGVSFTDAQLRAGTYIGVPKPPFTPGYELVGVVEELGPDCSTAASGRPHRRADRVGRRRRARLRPGGERGQGPRGSRSGGGPEPPLPVYDRLPGAPSHREGEARRDGAGARRRRQGRHRGARAGSGGRASAYRDASARDGAAVERLGAVAIDYRNEDFLARVRELTGDGVDVVVDGLGGPLSLRSFRALRPGGRLVVFGHYATLAHGRKNWPAVIEWYAAIAAVWLWGMLVAPPAGARLPDPEAARRRPWQRPGAVGGEPRYPDWFREDFPVLLELLRRGQDPPSRGRAPAAVGSAPRSRAARALGGEGKTRARAVASRRRHPGRIPSHALASPQ